MKGEVLFTMETIVLHETGYNQANGRCGYSVKHGAMDGVLQGLNHHDLKVRGEGPNLGDGSSHEFNDGISFRPSDTFDQVCFQIGL